VVKVLLSTSGIEANSCGDYGSTPLLLAEESGHEAVVKILKSQGSRP
jgi:hypothetical protein